MMAKMKQLDSVILELHSAATALIEAADSLRDFYSPPTETPAQETAPEPPPITLEQVRAVLAEKSRGGHTEKIRELLKEFSADKLSDVDPECYEVLLRKAEVLGNG